MMVTTKTMAVVRVVLVGPRDELGDADVDHHAGHLVTAFGRIVVSEKGCTMS